MLEGLKERVVARGIQLINSPTVARAMESEQVGAVIEKAMSLPVRISEGIRTNKEKFTAFMELATRADIEEIKRSMQRVENELKAVQQKTEEPVATAAGKTRTSSRAPRQKK